MAYLAFCTFDLKNASAIDYQNAYADLAMLGLKRVVKATAGNDVVIPTTSTMGEFKGASAAAVRDHVKNQVQAAFIIRRFKSEIFVVVADDWAWGAGTT